MTDRKHRASAVGAVLTALIILTVLSYPSGCPAQATSAAGQPATQPAEGDQAATAPAQLTPPARLNVRIYRLDLPGAEIEKLKKSLAGSTDNYPKWDDERGLRQQGLLGDVAFVAVDLRGGARLEAEKSFATRRQMSGRTLMMAAKGKLEVSLPSVELDSNDPLAGQVTVVVSLSGITEGSRRGGPLPPETVSPFKVEYKGPIAPGKPAKVFTDPGPDKCVYLVWICVETPKAPKTPEAPKASPVQPAGAAPTPKASPAGAPADERKAKSSILRFRVVDPDGKPAAGVSVGTFCDWSDHSKPGMIFPGEYGSLSLLTDDQGRVGLVPADAVWRSKENKALVYAVDAARGLAALVAVDPDQLGQEVDVRLQPACRINGSLKSDELADRGRDLTWTNVCVYCGEHSFAQCMSANRTFNLLLPAGKYRLSAYGTSDVYEREQEFQIKPGQREAKVSINLPASKLASLRDTPAPGLTQIREWQNGGPVSLAKLRGNVVLLDFWGYWCGPCVHGMPALMKLHDVYGKKGLVIIAVHDDSAASLMEVNSKVSEVRMKYWNGRDLPFLVALDGGGKQQIAGTSFTCRGATTAAYGITSYPTTVLIGPDGLVIGDVNPYDPNLPKRIERLLGLLPQTDNEAEPQWRQRFDEEYRLEPGQTLRRIAPPFIPERAVFCREDKQARPLPSPPNRFIFLWFDGRRSQSAWELGFTSDQTLPAIISHVLVGSICRFSGSEDLMKVKLPGDWILDKTAPREELLASLAQIVGRQIGKPLHFMRRIEVKEVVKVRGTFARHPLPNADVNTIHLLTGSPIGQQYSGGGQGSVGELLEWVEQCCLHQPVVNHAEYPADLKINWYTYRSGRMWTTPEGPQRKAAVKELLGVLSTQTGLEFSVERAEVEIWHLEPIESDAPAAREVIEAKLDLAAGLAGKKLLVVAASIEQRPSRRRLDTLAAQANAITKQGIAIVLVHADVADKQQVKKWLIDHKLDVAQLILAKDTADAGRLLAACGAESLPFMLLTDAKHVVMALDVQPDKLSQLDRLMDIRAKSRQPTTSPADAAAGGDK